MAQKSKIEWTDTTWNPIRGCTPISDGCRHCYAARMAARFSKPGGPYAGLAANTPAGPRWTGKVRLLHNALDQPLRWQIPRRVFVNSMSDLFHEGVDDQFIADVFCVMNRAPQHQYQVLTKRSRRLADLSPTLPWASNIWMGVSVENAACLDRVDDLRQTGAEVKFLSLEPLLGPLPDLDLSGIDWAIVGGESGPGARPMDPAWVREIRDGCKVAGVPFFFKQWGEFAPEENLRQVSGSTKMFDGMYRVGKRLAGRVLDGRTWDEVPNRPQITPNGGPLEQVNE